MASSWLMVTKGEHAHHPNTSMLRKLPSPHISNQAKAFYPSLLALPRLVEHPSPPRTSNSTFLLTFNRPHISIIFGEENAVGQGGFHPRRTGEGGRKWWWWVANSWNLPERGLYGPEEGKGGGRETGRKVDIWARIISEETCWDKHFFFLPLKWNKISLPISMNAFLGENLCYYY